MQLTRFIVVAALATGCGKGGDSSAQPDPSPRPTTPTTAPAGPPADPVAKAKLLFEQRCTPCHGTTGAGDGVASASLNPKPRAFADAEWQASVTDEHLEQIIKMGGAAVGKSPAMPNNPDLINDSPTVAELRKIVRSFKK